MIEDLFDRVNIGIDDVSTTDVNKGDKTPPNNYEKYYDSKKYMIKLIARKVLRKLL